MEYPINRLVVRVGMALQIWMRDLPVTPWQNRKALEAKVVQALGLEEAVRDGLLKFYQIRWKRSGHIKTIWLVPADHVRRTPGLGRLRKLFLPKEPYATPK